MTLYQIHTRGFETRLTTSIAAARREAFGLARKGRRTAIYRLTPDGADHVDTYTPTNATREVQ